MTSLTVLARPKLLPLLKRKGKLAASSEALTNDPIRSSLRNERALVYGIFTTEKLHF
jgi:hypothetical protein